MQKDRIKHLEAFLKEDPTDAFVLFALAREYASAEQWEQSRRYFEELRSVHPDYVGLYYHYARLEEATGHPARAIALYEEGIVVARQAGDAHAESELAAALSLITGA